VKIAFGPSPDVHDLAAAHARSSSSTAVNSSGLIRTSSLTPLAKCQRTSSPAVLRGFSQSAHGRAATQWRCQALGVTSDDVADLPVGETVFGEPRMVGDPRITTAQAGVILKMTRH
jgi:hypothetical protein